MITKKFQYKMCKKDNKQAQMKNSFILFTQMRALWQNESLGKIIKAPDIQDTSENYQHHQNLSVFTCILCI